MNVLYRIVRKQFLLLMLMCLGMAATAQPPGTGWSVSYADEFNGSSVNESRWFIRTNGVFKKNALTVSNGTLKIRNSYSNNGVISGGWIQSKQKFAGPGNIKYGFYEARVRITWNPNGSIWPTWWIWGNRVNGQTTTEIDVMEYSGFAKRWFNNRATSSHHYRGKRNIGGDSKTTTDANNVLARNAFEWHRWGVLWTPNEVTFYYDGKPYLSSKQAWDAAAENNPLGLIFSSSPHTVNADPEQPDNPVPANAAKPGQNLPTFEIDWVRVYTGGNPGGGGGGGNPQVVAFRNGNKYVSSEDGQQPITCNRNTIGAWEKFDWVDLGNNKTAFRGSNGRYLSSEDGTKPMTCTRTQAGLWESFTVQHLGNQVYAFRGNNGKYVSSGGGNQPMTCNATTIGDWERFAVTWGLNHGRQQLTPIAKQTEEAFEVYPNPINGESLNMRFMAKEKGEATLSVVDRLGRSLATHSIRVDQVGVQNITLPTNRLNIQGNGWYIIRLNMGSEQMYKKVLMQ